MKKIPLTQGKFALVNNDNYKWLRRWKWSAARNCNVWYAARSEYTNGKKKRILMHREVLHLKHGDGRLTDHINNNGLDNRRSNLRACNYPENNRSCRHVPGASKYRGVCPRGNGRWRVQIRYGGGKHHLGTFSSQIKAAKIYDEAARKYHGRFATLNFPNNPEAADGI